jgi:hypothetical protein
VSCCEEHCFDRAVDVSRDLNSEELYISYTTFASSLKR